MVMLWVAVWALCFLGLTALVLDLGRVMAVKEQAQTAVDAGSLAASMHGVRYVKVLVPDRKKKICDTCRSCTTRADGSRRCRTYCCNCEYIDLGDMFVTGTREQVWDNKGWQREAKCGSCGSCCTVYCGEPKIVEQWIEFPGDTRQVAVQVTELNLPQEMRPQAGGGVNHITPEIHAGISEKQSGYASHYDPLAPSVIVRLKGWIHSMLAGGLFGASDLEVQSCGQSGTFFKKLSEEGSQTEKYNPRPEPG